MDRHHIQLPHQSLRNLPTFEMLRSRNDDRLGIQPAGLRSQPRQWRPPRPRVENDDPREVVPQPLGEATDPTLVPKLSYPGHIDPQVAETRWLVTHYRREHSNKDECPQLFAADSGYVVVAWKTDRTEIVEIPHALLGFLEKNTYLDVHLSDTGRGTFALTGKPVTDPGSFETSRHDRYP